MSNNVDDQIEEKIVFKKRKKRANTNRILSTRENDTDVVESGAKDDQDNDDDDSIDWSALDEYRELKRAKKRVYNGINILELMNESNKQSETSKVEKRDGGLTDAKTLASELDLGNTFSLETNRRDEDAELMKYVEEELSKRRPNTSNKSDETGGGGGGGSGSNIPNKTSLSDELLIKVIPENLLKISSEAKAKNEEMLSSQMLSGIPEIDLGVEERIRNIEKTEAARTKLLEDRIRRQYERSHGENSTDHDVSLVSKNISSCFTRHNNNNNTTMNTSMNLTNHRFNLASGSIENKDLMEHFIRKEEHQASTNQSKQSSNTKPSYDVEPVVVIGAEPQKVRLFKPNDKRVPPKDKPTDDYIFQKFRKQIKKH